MFAEYPELIAKKEVVTQEDRGENKLHSEILPFEVDYFRRLTRHYAREMELLPEKLQARQSGVGGRAWKAQDL